MNNSSQSIEDIDLDLFDDLIERYVVYWRQFVGVWELITCLIGAPANFIVALISLSLLRNRDRPNSRNTVYRNHHLCVLSMAVADFCFAAGHCPIMFAHYALLTELDDFRCRYMYFMTHCSTVASSVSLLLLNMDKFICIRYPIKYYIVYSRKGAETLIFAGWLLAISWSCFFIFGPLADGFDSSCRVYVYEPYVYYIAFVVTFFVFPITLSLLISLYVFAETIKARHCEYPCRKSISDSNYDKQRRRQYSVIELRRCRRSSPTSFSSEANLFASAKTSVWKLRSVTFVFITTVWSSLTCLPYRTAYLAFHFYPETWLARLAFTLFAVMIANAAGNPFITIFTQKQYRQKVQQLFRCRNFVGGGSSKSENGYEKKNRQSCPSGLDDPTLSVFIRLRAKTV